MGPFGASVGHLGAIGAARKKPQGQAPECGLTAFGGLCLSAGPVSAGILRAARAPKFKI